MRRLSVDSQDDGRCEIRTGAELVHTAPAGSNITLFLNDRRPDLVAIVAGPGHEPYAVLKDGSVRPL